MNLAGFGSHHITLSHLCNGSKLNTSGPVQSSCRNRWQSFLLRERMQPLVLVSNERHHLPQFMRKTTEIDPEPDRYADSVNSSKRGGHEDYRVDREVAR